jgi:4-diphosphocytidyl-2-C-methyl-D-erythritol kinase
VKKAQQHFGIKENVHIHIEKNIPVKGGLAGGSSNAATVLRILNELWNLKLDKGQLVTVARGIGMDIPFYFTGGTAFDSEATGLLEPVKTDIIFNFVLAIPDFGVSTSEAYKEIDYNEIGQETDKTASMKEALGNNDRDTAVAALHNDFEKTVFKQYPQLVSLKEKLLKAGCLHAVMSGSGSTLVGVAKDSDHANSIKERLGGDYTIIPVSTYC